MKTNLNDVIFVEETTAKEYISRIILQFANRNYKEQLLLTHYLLTELESNFGVISDLANVVKEAKDTAKDTEEQDHKDWLQTQNSLDYWLNNGGY